jgi:endo-1,4-beta-xylanase
MKIPTLLAAVALIAARTIAAETHPIIPLWPGGAPGSEARKDEPEKVTPNGSNVTNIHNPTLTVYLPPKDKATGCAVIVCPGGGHKNLSIQNEGYQVVEWLADHGIAAFLLKYRLGLDAANPQGMPQPYRWDVEGVADGQRALRLVRSRAAEWGVNPAAVGIIGFSAGGEIVAQCAQRSGTDLSAEVLAKAEPIDRLSSRPDFQGLIYPGKSPLIIPTKDSPPAFLACGFNDRPDISEGLPQVYLRFKQAGVPADLHVYSGVGHGFGMREALKTPHASVGNWPAQFVEWLGDRKFLHRPPS